MLPAPSGGRGEGVGEDRKFHQSEIPKGSCVPSVFLNLLDGPIFPVYDSQLKHPCDN